jgi:hypothetical protein
LVAARIGEIEAAAEKKRTKKLAKKIAKRKQK